MSVASFFDVDANSICNEGSPDGPLPEYVRKAGYFFDTACLKIGDIALTSPIKESSASALIHKNQSKSYDSEHAMWVHAAIYVGDGLTCEATTRGVTVREIYDHFLINKLKFIRRIDITDHQRYLCAIKALQKLHRPYNYIEIGRFIADYLQGHWRRRAENGFRQKFEGSYTCSGMLYDVFLEVLRSPPFDHPTRPSPADFSASKKFQVVMPSWVLLPGRRL